MKKESDWLKIRSKITVRDVKGNIIDDREQLDPKVKEILYQHEKWLNSQGQESLRADLSDSNLWNIHLPENDLRGAIFNQANLSEAYLVGANLDYTVFEGANLRSAKLSRANLQEAVLGSADLKEANLVEANLKGADFTDVKGLSEAKLNNANFEGATGLLGHEFAKADLTGVKLPEKIGEFETLKIVEETSKNARKMFFATILGCVYSWLTIATTTDVRLLTNSSSSPLPIIGTEIPIAWFYGAAPIVIMSLFIYLQFYLQKLWTGLAGLPAIFQDGKRLDERSYPWLLNDLVCRHFELLKDRPFSDRIKELIIIFLGWGLVPFTFIGYWVRYLPRHEWLGTVLHIALIVVSAAATVFFYRKCAKTLCGQQKKPFAWENVWKEKILYYAIIIVLVGSLFCVISYGAIVGVKAFYTIGDVRVEKSKPHNFKETIPWIFKKLHFSIFADFREKDVSMRPDNYWLIKPDERLESVKGANLRNRNLKFADMISAFLVKADLRRAILKNADLRFVDLRKAKLQDADLQEANLKESNLQKANLTLANLQSANLTLADLQNAIINEANLQNAIITSAKFQGAQLMKAKIQKAKLWHSNFENTNLFSAILVKSDFANANLRGANLRKANLKEANLNKANLNNAIFQETNLEGANLKGALGLTLEQLCTAHTIYDALLDIGLKQKVMDECPEILKKPVSQ